MDRVKITNRAVFYSQINETDLLDGFTTGRRDGAIILHDVDKAEVEHLIDKLNVKHYHNSGNFYLSESNPVDYDIVDYYIKYNNPMGF